MWNGSSTVSSALSRKHLLSRPNCNIDRLPQEVLEIIVQFLPENPPLAGFSSWIMAQNPMSLHAPRPQSVLASYCTISRRWQAALEKRLFESIRVDSSADELKTFAEVTKTPRRRALLRRLQFTVMLPTYDQNAYSRLERDPDREANDATFQYAVSRLFGVLHAWDEDGAGLAKLHLTIGNMHSPPDLRRKNVYSGDIGAYRRSRSRVHLRATELPEVRCVSSLTFANGDKGRQTTIQGWVGLVQKLPSLHNVKIHVLDNEMRYPGIRRDEHHGLARALQTAEYLPGFLERNADITVNLRQLPPEDQLVSLPDLIYPFSYDPLSAAFRTLSHTRFRQFPGLCPTCCSWAPCRHACHQGRTQRRLWSAIRI